MKTKHYWGYRINTDAAKFFWKELECGRLRQGWGYDEGQNLKYNLTVDEGASRNKRMLNVKKGDILLIPRIHRWDEVTIVEATEDWDAGYRFEIHKDYGDYGHIFPARFLRHFKRTSPVVTGEIRSSLHTPGRFWNMDYYGDTIEELLNAEDGNLGMTQDFSDRFGTSVENVFESIFDATKFTGQLFLKMCQQFKREEWEYALVAGLKLLYPEPYFRVEKVGGRSEDQHGTDITKATIYKKSDKDYDSLFLRL